MAVGRELGSGVMLYHHPFLFPKGESTPGRIRQRWMWLWLTGELLCVPGAGVSLSVTWDGMV